MFQRFFNSSKAERVLPNQSTNELIDAKEHVGSELQAAVYLYNDEKFIICSIAGISEYGEPAILNAAASDESLGLSLCDRLLQFQRSAERDISKDTLNDWAAFKASGAKTAKAFEQKSIYVYVTTMNSAIRIEAGPRVTNDGSIKALCSISNGRDHSEIGAAIRKAIEATKALRNVGML